MSKYFGNPRMLSVQTSASGTPFVPLDERPCDRVTFYNGTGTGVSIQIDGVTVLIPASPVPVPIPVRGNANLFSVKRTDESATPVTLAYLTEDLLF